MKKKIILFLATSIPYGIIMGALSASDVRSWLYAALIYGASFGLLMTIILSIIEAIMLRRNGVKRGKVKVHTVIVIELNAPKAEVYALCKESLNRVKKAVLIDESDGRIQAKAAATSLTWGDDIEFEINEVAQDIFRIKVSSRPSVPTTVIDYGKNRDNVARIMQYLSERIHIQVIEDESRIVG